MKQVIPPDVELFILKRIDSIAQLEAVLMLRNSPDTWWSTADVAERLYITEDKARPCLDALCQHGLLVKKEIERAMGYRYRPDTGELREMVDRLAYYYAKHLVPVSNLVHAKMRTRLEAFAEAFKVLKDNKH